MWLGAGFAWCFMNECLFKQILKFILIPAIFIAVALSNSAMIIIEQTDNHNHVIKTEFNDVS